MMEANRAWARVLVVDDDEALREMLRMTFAGAGCSVATARDGGEALAILESSAGFEAVVSDLEMPGADGVEVLGRVRDRAPGAMRVLISGSDRDSVSARAGAVAQHVLQKPFDPADLLTLLVMAKG